MSSHTEQSVQDVALIARNGIDRIIELQRQNTALQTQVIQLQSLSDDLFSTMLAALSLAPVDGPAYKLLDEAVARRQEIRPGEDGRTEQNSARRGGARPRP